MGGFANRLTDSGRSENASHFAPRRTAKQGDAIYGAVIPIVLLDQAKFREKKLNGDGVSDKFKGTRRHPTHRRKQFFRLKRLVEKFISSDGIACFAGFDAAGRTHNQDLGIGKV